MTWIHYVLYIRYKSWFPCKLISSSQSVLDLDNPIKIVVYYLLVGRVVCLGRRDRFFMVKAPVYAVMHWIGSMVNQNVRLSIVMIHQDTMLKGLLTLKGY